MNTSEFLKNKKILIVLSIITVLFIGGIVLKVRTSQPKKIKEEIKKEEVLPKSELVPTVDSSVDVNLISQGKKEVILTIKNVPAGTSSIEYELSYLAKGNLPKGVVGTIDVKDKSEIERKITLGTCSSGSCVYDEGVTSAEVSLKFEGERGSSLFNKKFEI